MARKPVVLVTGASKGIGLAITRILLEQLGATVATFSRTKSPELLSLLEKHSASLLPIECDVADEAAVARSTDQVIKTYQNIDGLILNAGVLEPMGKVGDPNIGLNAWKQHFDVNFFSLVSALTVTLPALRKSELGGRVIFVSSGAAVGGISGWGAYNASKAAMNSLARTLANDEPDIISVAVRPGMVDTNMQQLIRDDGNNHLTSKDYSKFTAAFSEGKLVKPDDCGHVIAALALKAPKTLTGQFVSWDSEECKEFRRPA
ncbi:hypothetical protein QCA50_000525 [Cerrena zonata]|uniref:Ketoreductase domain-containing protein n=1 Tax=Cerrena zonata TaxID=2478898 RepID=A0AAW0GT76_9APHY